MKIENINFDVLLTVHLSIFISVFNQLDAQNLFYNKFYFIPLHVSSTCTHHQEVKIALHSPWYHHTYSCLASEKEIKSKHHLSQYFTTSMHTLCLTISFMSCLYMFRAHVLTIRRSKLHYTATGIITPIAVMIPVAV
jgi:hypothetical protein